MFSKNILYLTNSVRSSFQSRTYRNVKAKNVQKSKNDKVQGNPGGNRMLALILDGEAPDMSNVTLEDIENGENDMLNSHLLYDQHFR